MSTSAEQSVIQVTKVRINKYQANVTEPIEFKVWFSAARALPHDMDWFIEWSSGGLPVRLEEVSVGVSAAGKLRFSIQGNFPYASLPGSDIFDVSVLSLVGAYQGHEFIRIGHYMRHDNRGSAQSIDWSLVQRMVAENAKVTQHDIPWADSDASAGAYFPPMTNKDAKDAEDQAKGTEDDMYDDEEEEEEEEEDDEEIDPNAEYSIEDDTAGATDFGHFKPPAAVTARTTQVS